MAKKKLNWDEKREGLAGDLGVFVRRYGRKAQQGKEPNDRRYSEEIEQKLQHLKPENYGRAPARRRIALLVR
jgi:hypothetical protein